MPAFGVVEEHPIFGPILAPLKQLVALTKCGVKRVRYSEAVYLMFRTTCS